LSRRKDQQEIRRSGDQEGLDRGRGSSRAAACYLAATGRSTRDQEIKKVLIVDVARRTRPRASLAAGADPRIEYLSPVNRGPASQNSRDPKNPELLIS
jgi:hypothetical protein